MLAAGAFLGLLEVDPEQWFQGGDDASAINESRVQELVDARQTAKKARNFGEADRLREELLALGIIVEDTPQGPRWKRTGSAVGGAGVNPDERAA